MKGKKLISIILIMLFGFSFIPSISFAETTEDLTNVIVNNQVIVKLKKDANSELFPQTFAANSIPIEVKEEISTTDGQMELLQINNGQVSDVVEQLKEHPSVEYAEPNYKIDLCEMPNDPYYSQQWGLKNTGAVINGSASTAGIDIKAENAWSVTKGNPNIIVAVIDTGIDITHPDLRDNIYSNPSEIAGNGTDDDENGLIDDINGWDFCNNDKSVYDNKVDSKGEDEDTHGTHIAGIIAASSNDIGVVGVAPNVKILPLKVIEGADGGTLYSAIKAIEYAERMGARIANLSWEFKYESKILESVIQQSSMMFVCAAGNDGQDLDHIPVYPAAYQFDNLISVGAMDKNGNYEEYSNYSDNRVAIAAPGTDIYSTLPNGRYGFKKGTSMAAPFVTGAVALLKSADNRLTNPTISEAISNWNYCTEMPDWSSHTTVNRGYLNVEKLISRYGQTIAQIPNITYGSTMIQKYTSIINVGGYDGENYIDNISLYNEQNKNWDVKCAMDSPRLFPMVVDPSAKYPHANKIFIFGGYDGYSSLNTASSLDVNGYQLSPVSPMPEAKFAAAIAAYDQKIYIFGGMNDSGFRSTVYCYDIVNNTYTKKNDLPAPNAHFSAVTVGGYIYLFGGVNETGCSDIVYRYSIENDSYEQISTMPTARRDASTVLLRDKIYLLAGSNAGLNEDGSIVKENVLFTDYPSDSYISTVEVYDFENNTWDRICDIEKGRVGQANIVRGGRIWLINGWDGDFLNNFEWYVGTDIPSNISITSYDDNFHITWDAVNGVSGYQVEVNGTVFETTNNRCDVPAQSNAKNTIRVRTVKNGIGNIWSDVIYKTANDNKFDAQWISGNSVTERCITANSSTHWYRITEGSAGLLNVKLTNIPENCVYKLMLYDMTGAPIYEGTTEDGQEVINDFNLLPYSYYLKIYSEYGTDDTNPYKLICTFEEIIDEQEEDYNIILQSAQIDPVDFRNNVDLNEEYIGETPDSVVWSNKTFSAENTPTAIEPFAEISADAEIQMAEIELQETMLNPDSIQAQTVDEMAEVYFNGQMYNTEQYIGYTINIPDDFWMDNTNINAMLVIELTQRESNDVYELLWKKPNTPSPGADFYSLLHGDRACAVGLIETVPSSSFTVYVKARQLSGSAPHSFQIRARLMKGVYRNDPTFLHFNDYSRDAMDLKSPLTDQSSEKLEYNDSEPFVLKESIEYALDYDHYKVYLNAGDKFIVNVTTGRTEPLSMYIIDSSNNTVAYGMTERIDYADKFMYNVSYKADKAGTYYICFTSNLDEYDDFFNYDAQIYLRNDWYYDLMEVNDHFEQADTKKNDVFERCGTDTKRVDEIQLSLDTTVDVDRFPVALSAGDKLSARIKLREGYDDTRWKFRLAIETVEWYGNSYEYESRAFDNPDKALTKSFSYIAPQSNTYYVTVRNLTDNHLPLSATTNKYDLILTRVSADAMDDSEYGRGNEQSNDYAATFMEYDGEVYGTPNAYLINDNANLSNLSIDNQLDVDWFEFQVESSGTKRLVITSEDYNLDYLYRGYLYDENFNLIGIKFGPNQALKCNLQQGRTYYFCVTIYGDYYSEIIDRNKYSLDITSDIPALRPAMVRFSKPRETNGKKHWYIYDDNKEHLEEGDLADGSTPTCQLREENLEPGIYTVFAYKNNGKIQIINGKKEFCPYFFDAVFYNTTGTGKIKINKLAYRTDWNWEGAWSDYSQSEVQVPSYTTESDAKDLTDCFSHFPDKSRYTTYGREETVTLSNPIWVSDYLTEHPWTEGAVWLLMEFEVTSGSVHFQTLGYKTKYYEDRTKPTPNFVSYKERLKSGDSIVTGLADLAKGWYFKDSTVKGIAKNAPVAEANFNFNINNDTNDKLRFKIENQLYTTGENEVLDHFATNVYTYTKNNYKAAAESDMMEFTYDDGRKLGMFGSNAIVGPEDSIWYFDVKHTQLTNESEAWPIPIGDFGYDYGDLFRPNDTLKKIVPPGMTLEDMILQIEYSHKPNIFDPNYDPAHPENFMEYYGIATHMGNFGVTNRYQITINNMGDTDKKFKYIMFSEGQHAIRYKKNNGDYSSYRLKYIPKGDATTNPNFAGECWDMVMIENIPKGQTVTFTIEVTMLTGCNFKIDNYFKVTD